MDEPEENKKKKKGNIKKEINTLVYIQKTREEMQETTEKKSSSPSQKNKNGIKQLPNVSVYLQNIYYLSACCILHTRELTKGAGREWNTSTESCILCKHTYRFLITLKGFINIFKMSSLVPQ